MRLRSLTVPELGLVFAAAVVVLYTLGLFWAWVVTFVAAVVVAKTVKP